MEDVKKKRIIILGAGISGLSCAWYLSKLSVNCEFIVLEKELRPGGQLQTENISGYLFEKGPRTFKTSRSFDLLDLTCQLELQDQLIPSDEASDKRYLWRDEKLQKFPRSLLSFSMITSFLKEWFMRGKRDGEEETIYSFATRRFNNKIAERLFDPLTIGVYAGDIHTLSMNSSFPYFKMLEEQYGSITKGLLKERFRQKGMMKKLPISSSLFSFKGGTQTLVDTLQSHLKDNVRFGEEVTALHFKEEHVEVATSSGILEADLLISTLPPSVMGGLFNPVNKEIADLLHSIKMQGLVTANLGFSSDVLPIKGFGYLVPSTEKGDIYGAIFDSKVFPQHNQNVNETRITVMMKDTGSSEEENIQTALSELKKHLKISALPEFSRAHSIKNAIPQFEIGHHKKIHLLKEKIEEEYPACRLQGNYLTGASVNECIANSKLLALSLQQELLSTF